MKILLANPATRDVLDAATERYYIKAGSRWPWSFVRKVGDHGCGYPFPFYLAYAAQVLLDRGFEVQVVDGVAMNLPREGFVERFRRIRPEVLAVETTMHALGQDLALVSALKREHPTLKVVLTGPTATTYAQKILQDHPAVDFALRGEYEFVLAELCQRLREGSQDLDIPGVAGRRPDGSVFVHPEKGFIDDINTLPRPAFELFPVNDAPDMTIYGDGINTYKPAVTLHSTRGCPYKCDFCLWIQVMYDNKKYRRFSPERVVDEMEYVIARFGAREIYFDDDDFCVNRNHVLGVCNEIKRRGLKVKWSCMGDAMGASEEMIQAMAEAGCIYMKFGVESGNKEILKRIGKPLDPEKAVQVSEWCWQYGIMTHATFVFGLSGETQETMRETLALANRIKFDYAQASIATPFPGTRMYDKLVAEGAIQDVDYNNFDGTRTCVFSTETLSAEEVVAFRKKAILSMILHKLMDHRWWRNFLRRNLIIYREYGLGPVLEPLKALIRL